VDANSGVEAPSSVNQATVARSVALAERGINSSSDFRDLMSALMSDVISGRIAPHVTTAACNAGGKMLKMIELEYRYSARRTEKRSLPVAFEN
jgi:hypothetical protein